MMIKNKLEEIFNSKIENLRKLDLGLTNDNYYFEMNNEAFIVRDPSRLHNNYDVEQKAIELVRPLDINVDIVYYNDGLLISKYLDNALTFSQYQGNDKIIKTAKLMKKFHRSNLHIDKEFHLLDMFNSYYSRANYVLYEDIKNYHYVLDEIAKINNPKCLCHNDWVEGNMLFNDDKEYLIDYEYAGENDPLFDVVSFLTENNIYDEKRRKEFYDNYFDNLTEETLKQIQTFETFENLLWYYWAIMMYCQKHNDIYLEIAKDKYSHLNK